MNDTPTTGGRWSRDPKTGALKPLPEDGAPVPIDTETTAPAPETAPAETRKGAK